VFFKIPTITAKLNTYFIFRKIQGIASSESLFIEQTLVAHLTKRIAK